MWPAHVYPSSTIARNARYAFLRRESRKYALSVALICIAGPSLCLAIIIALLTEVLRRRATSTGKGVV